MGRTGGNLDRKFIAVGLFGGLDDHFFGVERIHVSCREGADVEFLYDCSGIMLCHRCSMLGLGGNHSEILRSVSRSGVERGELGRQSDERETIRA